MLRGIDRALLDQAIAGGGDRTNGPPHALGHRTRSHPVALLDGSNGAADQLGRFGTSARRIRAENLANMPKGDKILIGWVHCDLAVPDYRNKIYMAVFQKAWIGRRTRNHLASGLACRSW